MNNIAGRRYRVLQKKPPQKPSGQGRKILVFSILFLSLLLIWLKIKNPETFPILQVKIIDNSDQVDHKTLHDTVFPFLSKGMLFINLSSLKTTLENIPWVEEAVITRKFPHTLMIQILERKPIARWNNSQLLDTHGNIFIPPLGSTYRQSDILPSLFGPENLQNSVWSDFQEATLAMSPFGISIKTLKLDENGTCDIILSNDMHLLAEDKNINESLTQFAAVYPRICQSHEKEIETIDLRYTNGFAIQWKNNKISD